MRRNELADARDLKVKIARVLDEATVQLLALTSPADAVIRAAYEERHGVPAYDDAPGASPRDELKRCPYCGVRFWAVVTTNTRIYCSAACCTAWNVRRKREERARLAEPA